MGFVDDAKETVAAAAEKVSDAVEDTVDDEVAADMKVKKAEAEAESVKARNEAKEKLRDDE